MGVAWQGRDPRIPASHPWEHCVPSPALAVVSGLELWAEDQLAACSQPVHSWPSGLCFVTPGAGWGSSEMPLLACSPVSNLSGSWVVVRAPGGLVLQGLLRRSCPSGAATCPGPELSLWTSARCPVRGQKLWALGVCPIHTDSRSSFRPPHHGGLSMFPRNPPLV